VRVCRGIGDLVLVYKRVTSLAGHTSRVSELLEQVRKPRMRPAPPRPALPRPAPPYPAPQPLICTNAHEPMHPRNACLDPS
jgi:hypothetical protein